MMTLGDLDLSNARVKFCNLGFSIGKSENSGFFRNYAACDLKVDRWRQINEYRRSMSFLDLGPRSFTYENFNLLFSETTEPFLTKNFLLSF